MTPERWQKIKEIFQVAMERQPSELGSFLEEACRNDSELRKEVEALISSHKKVGDFLQQPADFQRLVEEVDSSNVSTLLHGAVSRELTKSINHFPVTNWDRYEFVEFLGEGGMGKVYKARDPKLNRYVALKFIRGDELELVERFMREARAQAKVEHNNICKVHEVDEVQGNPYIAMQFINGATLKEAGKNMSLRQKVEVMRQVAEAVHAAHKASIIHRDIKPSNILVEQNGEGVWLPYVTDFGLAREISDQGKTITGAVLGTPAYMSPEQARGEVNKLNHSTDIYSLGATLYELLAGRPPFSGSSGAIVIAQVLYADPTPVRSLNADIPVDLEAVVMKCLEKEPQHRYESAKALANDLQRFLNNEPVRVRKIMRINRLVRRIKKNKIVAGLTVGLFLTVAMLISQFAGWNWNQWNWYQRAYYRIFPLPPVELIPVKGRKFIMGTNKGDEYAQPEHLVEVKSFRVSRFLVTNRQYVEFVRHIGHRPPADWVGTTPPASLLEKPVTNVSYDDANAYCDWLTTQTGQVYRLLSEAEWEFIARNKAQFGVNEFLDKYIEWTGTSFGLYPGSKIKTLDWPQTVRIFRGKNNASESDPITYRFFQYQNYTFNNLGFRVAQ